MRKHFLILMLLTLLPLAGWAQEPISLTDATITDQNGVNLQYVAVPTTPGIASVTLSNESAADLDHLRAKYYSVNGSVYTDIGFTAPTNAGNYAMSVVPNEGDAAYSGESTKLDFVINKIPLTIAFADVHKYFDEEDPEPSLFTFTIPTRSQLRGEDNENTIRSTFTWVTKTREAGTAVSEAGYPYTIAITATNYEVTVGTQPKLFIDRAPLTITFADASVAYGATAEAEATAIAAAYTIKDRNETAIGAELLAALVEGGFVVGRETPDVIDAAPYEYTFTSGNVGNYTITRATGDEHKFTINQRTIGSVAPNNCKMTGDAAVTYDATGHTRTITADDYVNQAVTFNTKWVKLDAPIPNTDRQKAYQGTGDYVGKTFDNPVHAGTYYAVIKGTGNFTNYYAQDDWKITINKKPANITVKNYSTPYTGADQKSTALSKIGLSYTSLALPDVAASLDNFGGEVSVQWISEPTDVINADDYAVKVVCAATPTSAIKNYDITWTTTVYYANVTEYNEAKGTSLTAEAFAALSDEAKTKTPAAPAITGKYTITKLNVTAKAQTLSYVLGSETLENAKTTAQDVAITNENVLFEPAVLTTDLAIVQAALKLQVAKRVAGYTSTTEAYEGAAVLTVTAQPDNYNITPVNGAVQVTKAPLNIAVETATAKYGDKIGDIEFSYYAGGKTLTPTAGGLVYKVKKNAPETGYYTAEELIEVGTYVVELDPTSYTLPEGYAAGTLDPGYLVVSKKVLNITIEPVSLNTGDGLTELQKYASVDAAYKDDLADKNADIEFTIEFSDDANLLKNYGSLAVQKPGLKSAAEYTTLQEATTINYWDAAKSTLTGVTKLVFDADADANKNYDIHFTPGKIVLGGAKTLKLDITSDQLAGKIADAAASGNKYTVTLPSLTLKANEWYAFVLPFETSALELVKQLDQYVVLNTYNVADSKPGKIVFSLEMGTIGAGVPFLVKAGADLNLTGKYFEDKDIVATPVAQGTMETNGSVYTGVFSTGNVLLNGYELDGTTAEATLAYQWLSHSYDTGWNTPGNYWRAASAPDHHKRNLTPLEAYLQVPANNAPVRITVEDFDGQTTSIKTLSAGDLKVATSEGWYTINGIKLQNAPTEKGVYINNGKKVVIK